MTGPMWQMLRVLCWAQPRTVIQGIKIELLRLREGDNALLSGDA
jgi:hypothetical protein